MSNGISIEDRLEGMSRRLERAEKANRAVKIWGSIAFAALFAFGSGPFASAVMAKKSVPAKIVAQQFDLVTANGTPLASLVPYEGGSTLVFFSGGATPRVGIGYTATGGGGVETFDEHGTVRVGLGTDPTGSGPNGLAVYDANGKLRIGVSQSVANGNAFYLEDKDGTTLRGVLYSDDAGSAPSVDLFDATGAVRNGIIYDPSTTLFNGFYSQDGNNNTLSVLGNVLGPSGVLATNDSFMQLLDTSGTVRVAEFQNSTNEGGVDFNAGSTTVQGSWGNP